MTFLNNKTYRAMIVVIILIIYSSTYIIREGSVGVVLYFGEPQTVRTDPNLYLKWPWPISEVKVFDSRSRIFIGSEEQVLTKDQNTLIVKTHCVWRIKEAKKFRLRATDSENFNKHLNDLLRSKQNSIFGKINFKDIFYKDKQNIRSLDKLENDLTITLQKDTLEHYGVEIIIAGFDKVRLPETVMQKVYGKMISNRQQQSEALRAEGESEATKIRTKAKAKFDQEIAQIEGQVKEIIGRAESESIEAYKVFAKDPNLAMGLKKIESLDSLLKDRSTVILDPSIAPLDILKSTDMGKF